MTATNAKYLTWKGEDDAHYIMQHNESGALEKTPSAGPSFLMWAKVRFDKDKPKLIDPAEAVGPNEKAAFEYILKKAATMAVFVVEDVEEPEVYSEETETLAGSDQEPDQEPELVTPHRSPGHRSAAHKVRKRK